MKRERFNQIVDDLFKAGFEMTHAEQYFAVFGDGNSVLTLDVSEGIEVEE